MSQFIMISKIILYNSLLFVGLNVEEAIIGKEKDNIDLINVILHSFQLFFLFYFSPVLFRCLCLHDFRDCYCECCEKNRNTVEKSQIKYRQKRSHDIIDNRLNRIYNTISALLHRTRNIQHTY